MKKTYYFITYVATVNTETTKGQATGNVTIECSDSFLNRKITVDDIRNSASGKEYNFTDVTITNILKLTKKEYEIWNRE